MLQNRICSPLAFWVLGRGRGYGLLFHAFIQDLSWISNNIQTTWCLDKVIVFWKILREECSSSSYQKGGLQFYWSSCECLCPRDFLFFWSSWSIRSITTFLSSFSKWSFLGSVVLHVSVVTCLFLKTRPDKELLLVPFPVVQVGLVRFL